MMPLANSSYMNDLSCYFRWRILMRKALTPAEKAASEPSTVEQESKVDEDEQLLNEMEELTNAMDRKKKRTKKIIAKRQAKVRDLLPFSFTA